MSAARTFRVHPLTESGAVAGLTDQELRDHLVVATNVAWAGVALVAIAAALVFVGAVTADGDLLVLSMFGFAAGVAAMGLGNFGRRITGRELTYRRVVAS